MSSLRDEAQDPKTSPERLHELTQLPGDRSDIDSDSGWCREYVAANPSASPETLTELAADMDDFMSRLHAAQNPSTPLHVIQDLTRDRNEQVSRAAWARLGGGRPGAIPSNPVIGRPFRFNPKTGRFE